jgi:uncharacterized repeat protein (TIGR01451 family)
VLVCAGLMGLPAVASAATISESFTPTSIALNDTTTVTLTIDNADTLQHAVSFDDALPGGVQLAGTPTTTCPGLPTSTGPSDLGYAGTIAAQSTCTVSATLRGVQAGAWENPVSMTTDAGVGGTATADASIDIVAPPSISAAFGTALLGLDGATPLTFTITNPNPTFALTGVSFTDTLPTGMVIAAQPATTNSCGGTLTAVAGTDSLGLSGGQLAPGTCTVSATVVATATGTVTDTTTQVTSTEGGIGNTASAALTVIGAPTVALSSPAPGHAYAFGQQVPAAFRCADDPNGPGISSCTGTVPNGSLIATGRAGAHSFTVTATSLDGGVASDTVFYSVAPDNRFTVTKRRGRPDGSIEFVVKAPGPGRITVLEKAPGARFVFARATAQARRAGKLHLTISPTARGRRTVQHSQRLRVTVTVGYTPKGGTLRTFRFVIAA